MVGASHSPRRWCCRSARSWAPSGSATSRRWATSPPQPGWVQPPGRLQQHRFGLGGEWAARSWVPWASTWAWAGEMSPAVRAWAVAARGPRNSARAVRTQLLAALAPSRSRAQPAGGGGGLDALLGPGGPRPSTAGQPLQPLAFQPVHQPPQLQDPLGQGGVGQPVQVLGGQPVDRCRQRRQPAVRAVECVFESMSGNLSAPTRTQAPNPNLGTNVPAALPARLSPGRDQRSLRSRALPGPAPGQVPGHDPLGDGAVTRLLAGHEGVLADLQLGRGGGLVAEPVAGVAVDPEAGLDPVGALDGDRVLGQRGDLAPWPSRWS